MAVTQLYPRRAGEILDLAVRICRARYATLMQLVAIVVVPLQLFSALALSGDSASRGSTTQSSAGGDALSLVASILAGLTAQLASAVCLKAIAVAHLDQKVSWRESFDFARRRGGDLLGVLVVLYLAASAALVLLVLPGIYLWISWVVAVPVLLLEGGRGTAVLRRSYELVRGRWWPTLGTYLLASILLGIINIFVSGVLLRLTGEAHAGPLGRIVLSTVVGSVAGVVTMPFLATVIVLIYFDLRARKEQFSLSALASLFGREVDERPEAEPPWPGVS